MAERAGQQRIFGPLTPHELKVVQSVAKIRKMVREASVNPDAYEADAITSLERRKKYRTQAEEERKRYLQELKDLAGNDKREQSRVEKRHFTAYRFYRASQAKFDVEEAKRALSQDVDLLSVYLVALHFYRKSDEESEKLGDLLFEKARNVIEGTEQRRKEIDPIFTQAYITFTKWQVLKEKGEPKSLPDRRKQVAAQKARLRAV